MSPPNAPRTVPARLVPALAAGLRCALFASVLAASAQARADREYTVAKGQTLSRIAARYGVSVAALAAANGIARNAAIRPGQVLMVPPRGVVYAAPGDSLASIARRHQLPVAELARTNHLRENAPLQLRQRLLLPGAESAQRQAAAERRWGVPRHPGVVRLYRVWSREIRTLRLVDARGRTRLRTLAPLSRLLRPRTPRVSDRSRGKKPHPRLVRLLARLSDHFGGRPLYIISGYRHAGGYTKPTSRHVAAQAVDLRIPGVPLQVLRDYCASFDHVGVGYYPRSHFVHLDVRRKNARWTDYSGPGEAPQRRPPAATPSDEQEAPRADEPDADDDGQAPIDDQADAVAE